MYETVYQRETKKIAFELFYSAKSLLVIQCQILFIHIFKYIYDL